MFHIRFHEDSSNSRSPMWTINLFVASQFRVHEKMVINLSPLSSDWMIGLALFNDQDLIFWLEKR